MTETTEAAGGSSSSSVGGGRGPGIPAIVKHAGSTHTITLPPFAETADADPAAWACRLALEVAAATAVPPEAQRLMGRGLWKGRLDPDGGSFRSGAALRKKLKKAANAKSPPVLMLFEDERAAETKLAMGATIEQLFEEDVQRAVRNAREEEARHGHTGGGSVAGGISASGNLNIGVGTGSGWVARVEAMETAAMARARHMVMRAAWRRRAQQLHNQLGDALAEWLCESCTFAGNPAEASRCIVCKEPRGQPRGGATAIEAERPLRNEVEPLHLLGLEGFNGHTRAAQVRAEVGGPYMVEQAFHSGRHARLAWLPPWLEGATVVGSSGPALAHQEVQFAFAAPVPCRVWLGVAPQVFQRDIVVEEGGGQHGVPSWIDEQFEPCGGAEVVLVEEASPHLGSVGIEALERAHMGLFVCRAGLGRGDVFLARSAGPGGSSGTGRGDVVFFVTTESVYTAWRNGG